MRAWRTRARVDVRAQLSNARTVRHAITRTDTRDAARPGDVITEIDGAAIKGTEDLLNVLETKQVGQTIQVTVQRGTMLASTRRVSIRLLDVSQPVD